MNGYTHSTFPVEPFERFLLAGDSAEFPMSFVFEFEFEGQLEPSKLGLAIQACAALHPLLFATVDTDRKLWRFDQVLSASVMATKERVDPVLQRFDLSTECGVRVIVSDPGPTHQKLMFAFHHACVDGLGALQFVNDVAKLYGSDSDLKIFSAASPQAAIAYLRKYRRSYGGNRWLHFFRWPVDLLGMLWTLEMVLNRPKAIEPESPIHVSLESSLKPAAESMAFVDRILTLEQSAEAKRMSRSVRQTLNDRVIQSFFLATEEWNAKYSPGNAGALIRLMVPMNLRRGPTPSAANMVAMVNFDRVVGRWKSTKWFAKLLRLEMQTIKRFRAGVTANRYLQLQEQLLGRWPMQENRHFCFASCLVSNLGDLSRAWGGEATTAIQFGTLPVTNFRVIAPLRPKSNVFVCLFSLAGQLNFNVTFNSDVLDKTQVEFLLDAALRRLLGH